MTKGKKRDFAVLLLHSSIFNRPTSRYSKLCDLKQCVCFLYIPSSSSSVLRRCVGILNCVCVHVYVRWSFTLRQVSKSP